MIQSGEFRNRRSFERAHGNIRAAACRPHYAGSRVGFESRRIRIQIEFRIKISEQFSGSKMEANQQQAERTASHRRPVPSEPSLDPCKTGEYIGGSNGQPPPVPGIMQGYRKDPRT
jgi:hypothetical protein